jgi:MtrB/PioB family decaheme-associated outer membrane protein
MKPSLPRCRTPLALAVLALLGAAAAQAQSAPDGLVVEFGAGIFGSASELSLYNQHRGLRVIDDAAFQLGAEYRWRDPAGGLSTSVQARDLLGGNREVAVRLRQPDDWTLRADYGVLTRRDPRRANTGLGGAGTVAPQVNVLPEGAGSGDEFEFKVKRTGLGLALTKVLSTHWQIDAALRGEDRRGSRLFGVGMTCPSVVAVQCRGATGTETGWALLLLPEPIRTHHTEADLRVSFGSARVNVSLGYHGSFFQNSHATLQPDVPGALYNGVGTLLPLSSGLQAMLGQAVALPPDNDAHQVDLTGSVIFDRLATLNFKLARALARQNEDFASAGFNAAPAGVSSLDGRVLTTLAQVGLSARPLPRLSTAATLRYEDRDDRTPLATYNVEDTASYTNRRLPSTKLRGKAQADLQIDSDHRGGLAVEHEAIDRGAFTASSAIGGVTALRQKTDETVLRAQLRRRLTEAFSGAVVFEQARRSGSNWLKDNSGLGVSEVANPDDPAAGLASGIFMPTLADRRRDKLRLNAQWQPTESLQLQASADRGKDRYSTPSVYGLRHSGLTQFALDADLALDDGWRLAGNFSHGRQDLLQARPDAAIVAYDNLGTTLGLGVEGRPTGKLEVGASFNHLRDRSRFTQTLTAGASAAQAALLEASGGLPDINFRQSQLRLNGRYAVEKDTALKLELLLQRARWTDWTWGAGDTPFAYADGSTVRPPTRQNLVFVGLGFVQRWR